jgi:uncharacterized protein (TIGR02597 family)
MKSNSLKAFAFGFALLGAANSFGQTQAVTDPVGFITLNIAGGGSIASPKLSLVSATLTRPILYQGVITDISGVTITVSATPSAPWAAGSFVGANGSHYVEIISTAVPSRTGTMADISGTPTGNTLTTVGDLSVNQAAVGDTIRVRKDVTISDLFGATNSAGLLASDDASTADEVFIYSNATAASHFYYTGDISTPAGWYNSTSGDPAGNRSIAPNEAVVVKRKAAAPLSITFAGSVKTGNTLMAVVNGLNVLGTASAKGLTLDTSGLHTGNDATGVKGSDDASTADEVTVYGATTSSNYFYYTGDVSTPAGWYNATSGDPAGGAEIPAGTAFVLRRKGGASFNWALPSPTAF